MEDLLRGLSRQALAVSDALGDLLMADAKVLEGIITAHRRYMPRS